jgi:putative membrane protein
MTESTDLRDRMALERTRLANERTLLAYIRTAIALIGAGTALIHFFDSPSTVLVGGTAAVAGVLFLLMGGIRFHQVASRISDSAASER